MTVYRLTNSPISFRFLCLDGKESSGGLLSIAQYDPWKTDTCNYDPTNTGCHEAVSSLHMQCKVLPFQGHLLILVLLENICSEINCVVLNSEIKTKAVVS